MKKWMDNDQLKKSLKSIEQGASTSVWAAVAPEFDGVGGLYLEDCAVSKLSTPERIQAEGVGYLEYAMDKANARKLWDISMNWLKNPPK